VLFLLAQLGEMISVIAHQWKQLLNAISVVNTILEMKALKGELDKDEVLNLTEKISHNINVMSETIEEFRNFFSPKKEKTYTTLKKIIESVLKILEYNLLKNKIKVIRECNSKQSFFIYENEIKHVVLNIMQNAIDALVENRVKDPYIKIKTYDNVIEIEDNAGGIKLDNLDDIFNNYVTTKKNGTGIGLYMSKKIMKKNGGDIKVENTENGAKFTIILPTE